VKAFFFERNGEPTDVLGIRDLPDPVSNTIMTVEIGGPTESAKMVYWMWFHTIPADSWAVGGRFDDTYVKGRTFALARIIAPQGVMNTELKSRAIKEVARVQKFALGISKEEDDTGIHTQLVEIDDGQWAIGWLEESLHAL
jgi:hypothetical protein